MGQRGYSDGLIRRHGLDENQLCQLFADGEPRVTDETDEIILAGDEPNNLVFAKADFPQAILYLWCRAELLDTHRDSRLHAAQRANVTVWFLRQSSRCRIDVHGKSFAQAPMRD